MFTKKVVQVPGHLLQLHPPHRFVRIYDERLEFGVAAQFAELAWRGGDVGVLWAPGNVRRRVLGWIQIFE